MPFIPKSWRNKSQGPPYTYVTADDLNRIEQGVAEAAESGGGASDEQVAELVSDPATATGQALATTYVRSVNGVPVDPETGDVEVEGALPAGGSTGQVLTKLPDGPGWTTPATGGGSGGVLDGGTPTTTDDTFDGGTP